MGTSMNSISVSRPKRSNTARRCTACGGLECLCRPRFFAGQLLTEEDLNRLDHYIVAKNKLHNRYLHGWGVVCGLDVQCDGCDSGSVLVKQGYALSPCGEDVVVCSDQHVNVCDLINECRTVTAPDCSRPDVEGGCNEPVQQWILAICYAESASRGVAPLRSSGCQCGTKSGGCGCGGSSKSGGCGCGGGTKAGGCGCGGSGHSHGAASSSSSSSGGCGCGGNKGTVATTSASRGASLMQCENTITCEGYSFRVYKAPKANDRKTSRGALVDSFMACLTELRDALPPIAPTGNTQQELHDWCCEMHDALADWYLAHPGYGCETARRVAAIACPEPGDPNFNAAILLAAREFALAILDIIMACLCKALMPPCPVAPTDDCVPLAMVTVRTENGCTVQSICNWTTQRKYVMTFPTVQYWLSVLPFGRLLREAIERLCCRPMLPSRRVPVDRVPVDDVQPAPDAVVPSGILRSTTAGAASATAASSSASSSSTANNDTTDQAVRSPADNFRASASTAAASRDFMTLAFQALLTRERSDSAETLVRGLMGELDEEGEPVWTKVESDNALQRFVLDQMAKPMFRNLVGERGLPMMGAMAATLFGDVAAGVTRAARSSAASTDTDALEALQRTVERQQQQIEELMRQRPRGKNK